jgi:hypothetical protein
MAWYDFVFGGDDGSGGGDSGGGWWDEYGSDVLNAGLQLYNYDQSQDAIKDSQQAVEQGFQRQNPWAQYQPAMGTGLVNLLADPSRITETPGYQFAYDQGLQALFAKQAATGQRLSGRALTETMQYGQGLASQMYNQEMSRYAQLAGATTPTTGGIATGQAQSQLGQQSAFNQGYFLNQLFQPNTRSTSPTQQGSTTTQNAGSQWDNTGNTWGP